MRVMFKKYLISIGCILFSPLVLAQSKMSSALTETQLSATCQAKLIRIADDIIGVKRHRILLQQVPNTRMIQAFVLLSYNDQDSHLSFTVTPTDTDCHVSMNESYELPANCQEARQSIFKRWAQLGKLSDETLVMRYDHPRDKKTLIADENARAMAYLTETRDGKSCLISKQHQDMPLPPITE